MNDQGRAAVIEDRTLSMESALLQLFLLAGPLVLLQWAVFVWIWSWENLRFGLDSILSLRLGGPLFIAGLMAHEFVHGLSWKLFGRLRWQNIRFGVQLKTFTPYARPKVPIQAGAYRWGVAMPLLVVGFVPFVGGLMGGQSQAAVFGMIFTLVAGGDVAILRAMRGVPANAWVQDHGERAGCHVVITPRSLAPDIASRCR
jgi:hypothetical protein